MRFFFWEREKMKQMTCVICLESMENSETWALPGCGHRMHPSCLLMSAQSDHRCPVCRQAPLGVTKVTASSTLQDAVERVHFRWRDYRLRRKRALRRNVSLFLRAEQIHNLKRHERQLVARLHEAYDARCNHVWSTDQTVLACRRHVNRIRKKVKRLASQLDDALEDAIGAPPSNVVHFE